MVYGYYSRVCSGYSVLERGQWRHDSAESIRKHLKACQAGTDLVLQFYLNGQKARGTDGLALKIGP